MQTAGRAVLLVAVTAALLLGGALFGQGDESGVSEHWAEARERSRAYAECADQAGKLLRGWLDQRRDPETNLYSRGGEWNYHNSGADHYSSLVFIAHYLEPGLNEPGGHLHNTMVSYRKLCQQPNGIPRRYDLKNRRPGRVATFGELAEFLKDGLIRIVEVKVGGNIWHDELIALTDAMLAESANRGGLVAAFGRDNFPAEENVGNMLQVLSRLLVITGDERYLEVAETLAEHWLEALLADEARIMFVDHGGELIAGLGEWYVVESRHRPAKAARHRESMAKILDHVRKQHAHPDTGFLVKSVGQQPPDCWGYTMFAYENYDLATGEKRYHDFIERPLRWLLDNRERYREVRKLWPRSHSADDWSDSYESFIVLWNRHRLPGGFAWLDWATRQHIHRQCASAYADRPGLCGSLTAPGDPGVAPQYGPYMGRHFDGSTGRTLCIHMMLCAQGVRALPRVSGLGVGAMPEGDSLWIVVTGGEEDWSGRLHFDPPRKIRRHGKLDWARINEMPSWFVAVPEQQYQVEMGGKTLSLTGADLIRGLDVSVAAGKEVRIKVSPAAMSRD